jgi:hypothetical protein
MRNGAAWKHRRPALRTAAAASSSPPGLLPTPATTDAKGSRRPGTTPSRGAAGGLPRKLNETVAMLPTPNASDWKGSGAAVGRERLNRGQMIARGIGDADLPEVITTLFKTPTSQLWRNGGSQHPDKRKAGGHGPTLDDEVSHLLPTPTSNISGRTAEQHMAMREAMGRSGASQLEAAVQMLGDPSAPPSEGGKLSSAVPLPLQLSLDDMDSQG